MVVRVADHAAGVTAAAANRFSAAYEQALELLLTRLFGTVPDLADDRWDCLAEAFDTGIGRVGAADFCAARGVDITLNGDLVVCWRDIGIMLLARDRGVIG
jgi:hypothetical protein